MGDINNEGNEINWELVNKIQSDFEEIYVKLSNTPSENCFEQISSILKKENLEIYEFEDCLETFKGNLLRKLKQNFRTLWHALKIPQKLSSLEVLKNKYRNENIQQWRPYGKTISEQMLPIRISFLQNQIEFLEHHNLKLKSRLESVFRAIEIERANFQKITERRLKVLQCMKDEEQHIIDYTKKIANLRLKLLEFI